jgi:hypothetical protein
VDHRVEVIANLPAAPPAHSARIQVQVFEFVI